jgi:hypothetical protein
VLLSGTAGVGKTALAVHWAHHAKWRFPDGQLYVNLHGFDPGNAINDPANAVRLILEALGVPMDRIPATAEAQASLYRSVLAGKRVLIVADNARDEVQVRPLLPGTPGCLVVVTSRNRLLGLIAADGAHSLFLDLPTAAEARQMFAARLGAQRVAAEQGHDRRNRHPLRSLASRAGGRRRHRSVPPRRTAGPVRGAVTRSDRARVLRQRRFGNRCPCGFLVVVPHAQ